MLLLWVALAIVLGLIQALVAAERAAAGQLGPFTGQALPTSSRPQRELASATWPQTRCGG